MESERLGAMTEEPLEVSDPTTTTSTSSTPEPGQPEGPPTDRDDAPDAPNDDIAAAVTKPGITAARENARKNARNNFQRDDNDAGQFDFHGDTQVARDIVAGGVHNYYYGRPAGPSDLSLHARVVPSHDVTQLQRTYVNVLLREPPSSVGDNALLMVRGPGNCGRRTFALVSLAKAQRKPIYELHDPTQLRQLKEESVTAGAAYLLCDTSWHALNQLSLDFAELATALKAANATLVVTCTDQPDSLAAQSCFEIWKIQSPDPLRIARAHLTALLAHHGKGRQESSLNAAALVAHFATAFIKASAAGPSSVADLSATIATVALEGHSGGRLTAEVDNRLTLADRVKFESWFESVTDLDTKCFIVALAVLNKLPFDLVAERAADLAATLQSPGSPALMDAATTATADVFGVSRKSQLQNVRAEVYTATFEDTIAGARATVAVRFANPDYPIFVLENLWDNYPESRGWFTSWLRSLGTKRDDYVRTRAAVAAGVIALRSPTYVAAAILDQWADGAARARESAAIALDEMFSRAGLEYTGAKVVLDLWTSNESPRRRATAARCYGLSIGLSDIDVAIKRLSELAHGDEGAVTGAICRTFADLVYEDSPQITTAVLRQVAVWASGRDVRWRATGCLVFLFVAADLIAEPAEGSPPSKARWPALLLLALANSNIADYLARLWASALVMPKLSGLAQSVLSSWAVLLNDDPAGRRALATVLKRSSSDSRIDNVIRRSAQQWISTRTDTNAARCGEAVLTALTPGSS